MKKIVSSLSGGGFPFKNEDWISALQTEQYTALVECLKGITGSSNAFIITGCVSSLALGVTTVTAGYVFINNDIHYFPGGTINGTPAYLELDTPVYTTRKFKDGVTKNAVIETKLRLTIVAPSAANGVNVTTPTSISTLLTAIINNLINNTTITGANISVTAANDCVDGTGLVTNFQTILTALRAYVCSLGTTVTGLSGKPILHNSSNNNATLSLLMEDLKTYTLPANTLSEDGDVLRIKTAIYYENNANNKEVNVKFGGTNLAASGVSTSADRLVIYDFEITRLTSGTQRVVMTPTHSAITPGYEYSSGPASALVFDTAIDLTAPVIIKVEGQSDTNIGDVVCKQLLVEHRQIV
jgi:hypothetical protein